MRPTPTQPRPQRIERPGSTSVVLLVVAAGVVIGAVGLWGALAKLAHPSAVLVVRYVLVGLVYLGVGWLLARRGFERLGLLVALTGALWFVPEIQDTRVGIFVGLGVLLADVYRVTFAHAVLSYPTGDIRPRAGLLVVVAGYVLALVGGAARALTYQPYRWQSCDCPRNGFALFHNQSTYNHVNDPYRLIALILAVAVVALLAVKARSIRGASPVPIWTAFAASAALVVAGVVRDQADLSSGALSFWLWVDGVALLAVAVALVLFLRGGGSAATEPPDG